MVTDPQSHKHTTPARPPVRCKQTGPITIHCAAKLSAQSVSVVGVTGSKLNCSTNLFHHSLLAPTHLDCLLELYWTGLLCSTVFHFYLRAVGRKVLWSSACVCLCVCLSVCLCASARYLKNGFMDHHQIWWVGAGGEPLEEV